MAYYTVYYKLLHKSNGSTTSSSKSIQTEGGASMATRIVKDAVSKDGYSFQIVRVDKR